MSDNTPRLISSETPAYPTFNTWFVVEFGPQPNDAYLLSVWLLQHKAAFKAWKAAQR